MVSIRPYSQSYNMMHMYSIPDYQVTRKLSAPKDSIMGLLLQNNDFSRFRHIVRLANMEGILSDSQANFTLFIPSDTYLKQSAQLQITDAEIFNMDQGTARDIIRYSTLNRKINKQLLQASPARYLYTRNQVSKLYVTNVSGITRLNNCVKVIHFDIPRSNGLIHVTNGFVVPNRMI